MSYEPEIALKPLDLIVSIQRERSNILIVGNNTVDGETLGAWRKAIPDCPLCVVRRGSSLAAIDIEAVKNLGIHVRSTPGVNAPFVGEYNRVKIMF